MKASLFKWKLYCICRSFNVYLEPLLFVNNLYCICVTLIVYVEPLIAENNRLHTIHFFTVHTFHRSPKFYNIIH